MFELFAHKTKIFFWAQLKTEILESPFLVQIFFGTVTILRIGVQQTALEEKKIT